jgi:Protein of unknown function (DUF4230)
MKRIGISLILGIIIGIVGLLSLQNFIQNSCYGLPQSFCQSARMVIPGGIYIPPVERVQALSRLTTTRYNYAQIVTGQREMPAWLAALYGDGLVMVAVGRIDAGIDVSQITEEDISYDASTNTLSLTLPAPTIQNCFLDENLSYTVERNTAFFGQPMTNLEDSVRQFAVREFRDKAIEEGILEDATIEAEAVLSEFLGIVGSDTEVKLIFEDLIPDAEYPDSCR